MSSIDYGMGKTNIDLSNGIRYGVISFHEVLQVWSDESEPVDSNCCPYCGDEIDAEIIENATSYCSKDTEEGENRTCPHCKEVLCDADFMDSEPIGYKIDNEEYTAVQGQDDPDIFITKSPYYTICLFCSPCAPGAGYLMNPSTEEDGGIKAYCFGPDFFEDEKVPYKVYSIETDELIASKE